ncbi:MAG: hypothetical protein HYS75_02745 [Nitrosopumilales archaeon]|nr:hypothetical protein [Nitrosopumilales archaeon]
MPLTWAYANEETEIKITISGEPVIDLSSSNRMIRANVEVMNYNPQDGLYTMGVTQLSTQKIVSYQDIFVTNFSNGEWGTKVAYLLDEHQLGKDGEEIIGEYEIQIKTEFGTAVGKTNFVVIKSSESSSYENEEQSVLPTLETESEKGVETSQESESVFTTDGQLKIPEWVRNIFIWYAEGNISESELLNVIKVLIQQGIIKI